MTGVEYLVILSELDPVARAVGELFPAAELLGRTASGAAMRRLGERAAFLRRPGPHVHDTALDADLPASRLRPGVPLVFASIHRSAEGVASFTVHPLGNLGPQAPHGGLPRRLTPTAPRLMAAALRALDERADHAGLPASYEATHHGPLLERPAFFAEIGYADAPEPPAGAVRALAAALRELNESEEDRVALGVGGGHYVPHLSELATRRAWAFGHLISRHALAELDAETARAAWGATPGAQGIVFSRAADAEHPALQALGPRLRDGLAPRRARPA